MEISKGGKGGRDYRWGIATGAVTEGLPTVTFEWRPYGGVGASHVDTCGKNVLDRGNSKASKICLRESSWGWHIWREVRELGRVEGDEIGEQWPNSTGACRLQWGHWLWLSERRRRDRVWSTSATGYDLRFTGILPSIHSLLYWHPCCPVVQIGHWLSSASLHGFPKP